MSSRKDEKYYSYGLQAWRGKSHYYEQWHRHSEIEINFLENGFLHYQIGSQLLHLRAGDMAVFWGMTPHIVVDQDKQSMLNWIVIPLADFLQWDVPASLVSSLLRGEAKSCRLPLYGNSDFFYQWRSDLTSKRVENRAMAQREITTCLHRFANFARKAQSRSNHKNASFGKAGAIAKCIAENYRKSVSVAEIVAEVNLHPTYAMNLFRKVCQMSIVEYLTRMRITHVQRLLITTEDKVLDIAMDAGFSTPSRFYTAFHQLCGESPGNFRKKHAFNHLNA